MDWKYCKMFSDVLAVGMRIRFCCFETVSICRRYDAFGCGTAFFYPAVYGVSR